MSARTPAVRVLGLASLTLAIGVLPMCSSDTPAKTVAAICLVNSDCQSPLACTFGKCHQVCKATRDCPKGERCVQSSDGNVCQLGDETECTYDSDCDDPLKCAVDSICRNACKATADCLLDQECVDGSCAESSDVGADGHLKGGKDAGTGTGGTGARGGSGGASGGVGGAGGFAGTAGGSGGASGGMSGGTAGSTSMGGGGTDGGTPDASAGGAGGERDGGGPDAAAPDAAGDHHSTAPWHLWIAEGSTGHLFGYAPDQLRTTNGDSPEIDVTLSDNVRSIRFDSAGNLWGTSGGNTVFKFAAKDVRASGTAAAVGKFTENGTGNVNWISFDPAGSLWTSGYNGHGFYRYDPDVLDTLTTTSVQLLPKFRFTIGGASGTVFDAGGNLYAQTGAGNGTANTVRFAASQIATSGSTSDGPQLTLNPRIAFSSDIVVSPSGQLLVANGDVYRFAAATLTQTGVVAATPDHFTASGGLGNWAAFDPNGGLWVSGDKDKFVYISAVDLAKTGDVMVTPAVTILSPVSVSAARLGAIVVR